MAAKQLEASPEECHGHCYGRPRAERDGWEKPRLAVGCDEEARPGYNSLEASEYVDTPEVLRAKVKVLADLLRQAKKGIVYSGAGLSTASGIGDYASKADDSLGAKAPPTLDGSAAAPPGGGLMSPLCAQPTLAHRVLVAVHKAGYLHRWVNQNHDGLPQKAGLPQRAINEIHGAWHAPDNPVIQMSGSLREDLFADLLDCEKTADLAIAVGTSLCGMNADRVVQTAAQRAAKGVPGMLGSVIVCLQRTVHDAEATLRIFARCDDVFAILAEEMQLEVAPEWPSGTYYVPPVLTDRAEADYVFEGIKYDAAGDRSGEETIRWDLRDDAELVIPRGQHAGARGVIDGPFDREGNLRCRFTLRPKTGKLRAQMSMLLGRWWIQGAVDGEVECLPCVNPPPADCNTPAAQRLRELMEAYAA